ncbi:uncharacterized protein PHACADRAFT_197272 [Phanerochaete carnosa HHB-10118-sp]|uniref:Uncharacterized protein n=1 Tax=Phanerochaete carnosa (strain HHB-10118-sp) TaxID=650164 RepID=K5WWM4_PHACS|nr:uncharacterized protein PHACADRAFT_197272 [Phanerochaete carnosa HHB-10118-sp]EKM54842.1 hypothetical protein PHACADRAFT_197272 [Phanerochaete carnosa HHB-10118-sp]
MSRNPHPHNFKLPLSLPHFIEKYGSESERKIKSGEAIEGSVVSAIFAETSMIAGDATAKPFVMHHNVLSLDLYLCIAPELHSQQLVFGNLD